MVLPFLPFTRNKRLLKETTLTPIIYLDYIENLTIGCSQMNGSIVVVAAIHGQTLQPIEHLLVAGQVSNQHVVIFVNKVDAIENSKLIELF